MPGPLDGLIVLDFSTLLPGPMATLFLAEAGAQVIKIERPGSGEEMRAYEPKWGEDSVNFALLNRGKKSLALDLKDAGEAAKLMPWVQRADILVEQFRPGVMDRLGLGYRTLSQVNPGLVYCSITGYGQDGPKRDTAGHDLNYIGDAGLLSLSMGTASQPVLPPALIADIAAGSYPAVLNILLALRERDRTGQGCHLDISMAENVFPFLYWALGAGQAAGEWPRSGNELVTGGSPRYQLYPTSDGRFVAAAPLEQKFWDVFCRAIALGTDWRDDTKDPAGTKAEVARIIAAKPSDHWEPILARADCCCSIVRTAQEAMANAHFRRRRVFDAKIANAAGETLSALPVPIAPAFRASRDQVESAPALGAHNAELLR
ncbi:MAG: CaiB/BaiF CoA-transferase family protein [Alphaproteobacteria bacterium]|nr:CaiB/BaiF CoA-transferase family protein [Alphaproteobacteria bacterium]